MDNANPTFEISLAMAGAISAGAYSAGVIDFLCQALDEWYALKAKNPDDYPNHDVVLKAISGASAGAITGALAAAALRFQIPKPAAGAPPPTHTLTPMYNAWVVNVDLRDPPGTDIPGLLSTGDLTEGATVTSLLNSQVLEKIGIEAFGYAGAGAPLRRLPYVSKHLHVYLTVSNLRGVPYEISFQGQLSGGGYGMLNHADRVHFVVTQLGTSDHLSQWDGKDPGTELDVTKLPVGAAQPLDPNWNICLSAALASSAFPLGFSPRAVCVDYTDFGRRQWPFPHTLNVPLLPDFPTGYAGDTDRHPSQFAFTCVDGGLCNNEPFEYAHYALLEPGQEHNPSDGQTASRAVIMVDPFPELPDFSSRDKQETDLISVAMAIFSGLKDQARFKPSELAAALDDNCYSRFLISPSRQVNERFSPGGETVIGPSENAIACGLLGGFGGFLARDFRDHDYQLGRFNCYVFLKNWFTLPDENPVVSGWSQQAAANSSFRPTPGTANARERCIIPLVGACATPPTLAPWSSIGDKDIDDILAAIQNRADKLFPLFQASIRGNAARLGAGLIWNAGVESYVLNYIEWKIKSDLIRRDQYEGYKLGSIAARRVIAALADPSYDYYSEAYLVDITGVAPDDVSAILAMKSATTNKNLAAYSASAQGWTFADRAPSTWESLRDRLVIGKPTTADVPDAVKAWQKRNFSPTPPPPAPADRPASATTSSMA